MRPSRIMLWLLALYLAFSPWFMWVFYFRSGLSFYESLGIILSGISTGVAFIMMILLLDEMEVVE